MNRISMIFTGGTISMTIDPATGGAVPSLSGDQILARLEGVAELADIRYREFGKYPGPHVTPALMHDIARLAAEEAARDDVAGVIITHGTDTLEETAYFLDLVLDTDKPVILIGAMHHSEDPEWDGPANIRDAVLTVLSGQFRGLGVLTCLSGEINAARRVTKTHTLPCLARRAGTPAQVLRRHGRRALSREHAQRRTRHRGRSDGHRQRASRRLRRHPGSARRRNSRRAGFPLSPRQYR